MYVQGMVVAVPEANKEAYRTLAEKSAEVFKTYGVLQIIECWENEVPGGEATSFRKALNAQDNERIVFSWVVWPSKEKCEAAQAKLQEDPVAAALMEDEPFDARRVVWGGFDPIFTFTRKRERPASG